MYYMYHSEYFTFVTKYSSPVHVAFTAPGGAITGSVFTARVGDTLVAQGTLPSIGAPVGKVKPNIEYHLCRKDYKTLIVTIYCYCIIIGMLQHSFY